MKLRGFDFVVKHCPGKECVSGFFSRHSLHEKKISREEKDRVLYTLLGYRHIIVLVSMKYAKPLMRIVYLAEQ